LRVIASIAIALLLLSIIQTYGSSDELSGTKVTECKCVAFRLDDIQDDYLTQAQVRIVQMFEDRGLDLTIGVIANHTGRDPVLVSFLREKIVSDRFRLDVANHGLNHEDFTALDRTFQSELISESNAQILETLGVRPRVFIPPFNYMNEDTLLAVADNDMDTVSSGLESDIPFVRNVTSTDGIRQLYHFPRTAETGDIDSSSMAWRDFGNVETMDKIDRSIGLYGYAVVMMHPQEYSARQGIVFQNIVDSDQMRELGSLLDSVQASGYRTVTLSELANLATVAEFSASMVLAAAAALGALFVHRVSRWRDRRSHLPL
jgi:peptidoglycan/xylan/chitin deacetylase (PgdA/CDA1 family)